VKAPLLAVALVAALAAPAAAEIQKKGPQIWPGKFQLGAHVIGGQFGFTGFEPSGFRVDVDFAGRLKEFEKISLWLGGGFHYTAGGIYGCRGCGGFQNEVGFWAFVEISLEKLLTEIPLVPFVRAGPEGGLLYYGAAGGYFDIRIESGVHYFLTKNVGLGAQLSAGFGAGFYPGNLGTGFYGVVTAQLGARFAF
jgi:hypothetical protein